MKVFRLYNLTELSPASPLHFLERAGAEGYRDFVKWPYLKTGVFPRRDGSSVSLEGLDLRVEEVGLNAVVIPALELLLLETNGVIGTCYLLPGRCFDPDAWTPASSADLSHPQAATLLEEAQRRLRQDSQLDERSQLKDPRWQ